MDTKHVTAQMSVTGQRCTRRRVLAAVAGLAGLTMSETAAKRRQRGRTPRGAVKRPSAEVAAAYFVIGGGGPGPGPGI